jgi:hypothetical protein
MAKNKYRDKRRRAKERDDQKHTQPDLPLNQAIESQKQGNPATNGDDNRRKAKKEPMRFREILKIPTITDWGILVFTFVLAGTSYYQYRTINRQFDDSRIDQRAWLKISPPPGKLAAAVGQPIQAIMTVENIGKTTAFDVIVDADIVVIPATDSPQLVYSGNHSASTTGLLFPNSSTPITVVMVNKEAPLNSREFPIAVLEQADYDRLTSGDAYIAYFAQARYRDIFGKDHWTRYCAFVSETQFMRKFQARACTDYNSADH